MNCVYPKMEEKLQQEELRKSNCIQTWNFSKMLLQQIEGSNAFYVSGSRGDAEGFFSLI